MKGYKLKKLKEEKLLDAVAFDNEDDFILLLNDGVDVNCAGFDGRTPLYMAISFGYVNFIKILLDNDKVDVNSADAFGSTPLHAAARVGDQKLVQALVDRQATIDKANNNGVTPLIESVRQSHFDLAKFFLTRGANPNAVVGLDFYSELRGVTALHIAAMNGDISMIRLLVSFGADVEAESKEEYIPAALFLENYSDQMEEFDIVVEEASRRFQERANPVVGPNVNDDYSVVDAGKVRPSDDVVLSLKKAQVLELEEEEKSPKDSGNEDEEDEGDSSSSSSSPPDSPPGGGAVKSYSASLIVQQPMAVDHSLSQAQSFGDERLITSSQVSNSKADTSSAENMLMTLFAWIKDLPQILQQQVLSSFGMQQILKMLETTAHADKLINTQLSDQAIEEIFASEHKKYDNSDDYVSNPLEYAQVSKHDSLVDFGDSAEMMSNDGVFIDPLPKHIIKIGATSLFGDLTS